MLPVAQTDLVEICSILSSKLKTNYEQDKNSLIEPRTDRSQKKKRKNSILLEGAARRGAVQSKEKKKKKKKTF